MCVVCELQLGPQVGGLAGDGPDSLFLRIHFVIN
jgi:hypothetical protein